MIDIDEASLASVVQTALDAPSATLGAWTVAPLSYRIINRVTAGLFRVSGDALVAGETRAWSLVVKVLEHAAADNASAFNSSGEPSHWNYWLREAQAYEATIFDNLPLGLAAPRCYAVSSPAPHTRWLWLEDIRGAPATGWPLERFAVAARHLGRWQGAFLAGRELPAYPWLSRGWLRAWVPDLAPAIELVRDPASWQHPLLQDTPLGSHTIAPLLHAWEKRDVWLVEAEALPQTLCHLDFWPHNLFARVLPSGCDETVLLDWSQIGPGAPGEDIANLVLDSVWMQVIDAQNLRELERLMLADYVAGLREGGWNGDAAAVQRAYRLTGALRFGLLAGALLQSVHDASVHDELARRYGRPFPEVVRQRAEVVAHALSLMKFQASSLRG